MSASRLLVQGDVPDWALYLPKATAPGEPDPVNREEHVADYVDETLLRFVIEVRPAFDLLRDAISQTAAVLVLAASGSAGAAAHPVLAIAKAQACEARERFAALRSINAAQHGRRHFVLAEENLRAALERMAKSHQWLGASRRRIDIDETYALLMASQKNLKFAAVALPGLEVVSMSESCACHASIRIAE